MSTYKFCGGTCPQCPPGSTTYGLKGLVSTETLTLLNFVEMPQDCKTPLILFLILLSIS